MNRSKRVLIGLSVACISDAVVMGFGVRNSCDYDALVMPVYPMRGRFGPTVLIWCSWKIDLITGRLSQFRCLMFPASVTTIGRAVRSIVSSFRVCIRKVWLPLHRLTRSRGFVA